MNNLNEANDEREANTRAELEAIAEARRIQLANEEDPAERKAREDAESDPERADRLSDPWRALSMSYIHTLTEDEQRNRGALLLQTVEERIAEYEQNEEEHREELASAREWLEGIRAGMWIMLELEDRGAWRGA